MSKKVDSTEAIDAAIEYGKHLNHMYETGDGSEFEEDTPEYYALMLYRMCLPGNAQAALLEQAETSNMEEAVDKLLAESDRLERTIKIVRGVAEAAGDLAGEVDTETVLGKFWKRVMDITADFA